MIPPAATCSTSASAFVEWECYMPMHGGHQVPMAHEGGVSFVTQRWNEIGDEGHGLFVRPQSVFHRLGPKQEMCDPPCVPESVGEPPLPGMIFGCTNETFAECMNRELFGVPIANKPQVMRIAPGASLFLFNFRTKRLHGIFEAISHGGVHIVRDAFGGKFAAQVKFRLAEECPSLDELEFKEAILTNYVDARKFKFFLNEAQVCRLKTLFREKAVHAWALSEGIVSHKPAQFRVSEQQHARNTIQVQASPSHIRSRSAKGLEVSISSMDKKRNVAPDSPSRHLVMYDQSTTPGLRSNIIRPVNEGVKSRFGRENPQDRKRCADRSPHGRLLLEEQGLEIGENRPGKPFTDLRELLTRPNLKRLKSSAKELPLRLLSKSVGPPVNSGRKITKSDVLSDGILKRDSERGDGMQSQTQSGSHCVSPKPTVVETNGREVIGACRSDNAFNNMDFKTAAVCDGVGSCVQPSTSSSVKSGVLHNLDDVITESDLGDRSKGGELDISVSLTIEEKIARQPDSRVVSEFQSGKEGAVGCILGKRSRESSQHEPTLDSSVTAQAPKTERSDQQENEGPEDSHGENSSRNASSSLANVSESLQEMKNATRVASAEEQYLTSEAHRRNGSFKMDNLSKGEMRPDNVDLIPTNVVPLSETTSVVRTVITGNTGDMGPRDCKRHRAENESDPSSPVQKLKKVGQNDAGCSYVTPEVSTPTEGGDSREKTTPNQYGVANKMPLQILSNSLFSLKSGNLWNSRTLRYGRPRSADSSSDHLNISSKSGCEFTGASGKSKLDVVSVQIEEESVYGGGEDYESWTATETSRTVGSLGNHHPLLVCELGNPGGLPLDAKTIEVHTMDGSFRKDQPRRVEAVGQESMLPAETDSTAGLQRRQSLNTALSPRSDEVKTIEFGKKKIATGKGLVEDESGVADKICHTDYLPSKEIMQPAMSVCNAGRPHPNSLSFVTHGANAPQGFPSACTSTASDCSFVSGEAGLEINIPIEEGLEMCLPIEEEKVDAILED